MKKRLLSLAMAAVMTFGTSGTLPLASFADSTSIVASAEGNEYRTKEGTYTYRILEDGTAEITHFVADPEIEKHDGYEVTHPVDALIPSEVNGYTVTSIAVYAFDDSGAIKSITIPSTITKIYSGAFRCISDLLSINVDENNKNYCSVDGILYNKDKTILIRFPQHKFESDSYYDEELHKFVYPDFIIPDGVEHLASWSFAYCFCNKVIMPNSLKTLGHNSFYNSQRLTEIDIPNGVFFIGYEAFDSCYCLNKIILPESLKYFGENFSMSVDDEEFYDYTLAYSWENNGKLTEHYEWEHNGLVHGRTFSPGRYGEQTSALGQTSCLESIEVDSKNKYFSSYDGVLYNKDRTEIYYIPDSKTELSIPKEVKSINIDSLSELKKISVDKENESYTVEDSILYSKDKKELLKCPKFLEKETVIIPNGVETIAQKAFYWCNNIKRIEMPDSVKTIENQAFSSCSNLKEIKLSANLEKIDNFYTFSNTPWYEEIEKNNDIIYIGKVLYNGDKYTGTDLVVKDGTVTISSHSLLKCNNLKSITIPKSVRNIEEFSFGYPNLSTEQGSEKYSSEVIDNDFVIYCFKGTAAEEYAKKCGFKYKLLDTEYKADSDKTEIKIPTGNAKDTTLTIHREKDDEKTYSLFEGVEVDGKTVDPTNYTAKSGSLNLTLKASYLSTLSVGDHTMKVLFKDGEYVSKLTVVKN
ncbi:MAG: leucine-rich repeat protein, partial [Ruminococcus sp.]|nr:leucine-rich repeat protein [Ruminococcus sp.]